MKNRKLLLATVAGAAVLAAFASMALPLDVHGFGETAARVLHVDYREHGGEGRHEGHDRHGDDDQRYATNNCGAQGDDDDDDDGQAACGDRGGAMQQNANPPGNGLFTPGSKPTVQMN